MREVIDFFVLLVELVDFTSFHVVAGEPDERSFFAGPSCGQKDDEEDVGVAQNLFLSTIERGSHCTHTIQE